MHGHPSNLSTEACFCTVRATPEAPHHVTNAFIHLFLALDRQIEAFPQNERGQALQVDVGVHLHVDVVAGIELAELALDGGDDLRGVAAEIEDEVEADLPVLLLSWGCRRA